MVSTDSDHKKLCIDGQMWRHSTRKTVIKINNHQKVGQLRYKIEPAASKDCSNVFAYKILRIRHLVGKLLFSIQLPGRLLCY
jgi:hypothetical protein